MLKFWLCSCHYSSQAADPAYFHSQDLPEILSVLLHPLESTNSTGVYISTYILGIFDQVASMKLETQMLSKPLFCKDATSSNTNLYIRHKQVR